MSVSRVLILPRAEVDDDPGFVASPSQAKRKQYVRDQSGANDVEIRSVDQRAVANKETVYQRWGAERSLASVTDIDLEAGPGQIVVSTLPSVGADILISRDREINVDALQDDLGTAFIVSSDAALTMEKSIDRQSGAAEPGSFGKRYPQSNVAAAHRSNEPDSRRRLRGNNVLVGVLDTGVDADHKQFRHRDGDDSISHAFVGSDDWARAPIEGRGFDLGGHGTHVASIIGGRHGVAPACRLCAASSSPYTRNRSRLVMFAVGLDWLFQQFTAESNYNRRVVLNLSIGFPDDSAFRATAGSALQTFQLLLKSILDLDVLVVSSVGNRRGECSAPADMDRVLGVGAVDDSDALAYFSGSGSGPPAKPDILGYGVNVVGAARRPASGDNLYERRSGTSQAAAYVSGLAALYWQKFPHLNAASIRRALTETASAPAGMAQPAESGSGIATWDSKWTS